MADTLDPLLQDLVAWVAEQPRPYDEVMAAWRTSCPHLPVWEEAQARGYVTRAAVAKGGIVIHATPAGRAFIASSRSHA